MRMVKVQYAKTHLSALLAEVERGNEVIIARGARPIAKLVPLLPVTERDLGFVEYAVPESFSDPLPDAELQGWE